MAQVQSEFPNVELDPHYHTQPYSRTSPKPPRTPLESVEGRHGQHAWSHLTTTALSMLMTSMKSIKDWSPYCRTQACQMRSLGLPLMRTRANGARKQCKLLPPPQTRPNRSARVVKLNENGINFLSMHHLDHLLNQEKVSECYDPSQLLPCLLRQPQADETQADSPSS